MLHETLNQVYVNTFEMYFKAHGMHWNVEGAYFPQLHSFFGDLYEELFSAIDPIAEHIRTLNVYVPYGTDAVSAMNKIPAKSPMGLDVKDMVETLIMSNTIVISCLNAAFNDAQREGNQGIMNYLADRLDIHTKHGWMLRSISKGL